MHVSLLSFTIENALLGQNEETAAVQKIIPTKENGDIFDDTPRIKTSLLQAC